MTTQVANAEKRPINFYAGVSEIEHLTRVDAIDLIDNDDGLYDYYLDDLNQLTDELTADLTNLSYFDEEGLDIEECIQAVHSDIYFLSCLPLTKSAMGKLDKALELLNNLDLQNI